MKPNILFFLPDQHRPDWLGINSALPLRTPNLNRLCASGTRFVNAFTPSPLCAPARACLASGKTYQQCCVPSNYENYPLDMPTYYQQLRDEEYRVCGVGKFDLHKDLDTPLANLDWYLDGSRLLSEWGFTEGIDNEGKIDGSSSYRAAGKAKGPYLDYLQKQGLAEVYLKEHDEIALHRGAYISSLPDEAYCDNWVAENGLGFLRDFPKNQPWHLVVNFTGPHGPMDVTQKMHNAWQDVSFPLPVANTKDEYKVEDHQRNRRYYAAMLENIDYQIGRFLALVKQRGEWDNTIIVYASDHGEMLGDHNLWGKNTWYNPSTGIPLIIAGPNILPGVVSDALVSLHDLTATFLDYAEAKPLPEMESRSLRGLLAGKTHKHRQYVFSALAAWQMLFDSQYKLVTREGETTLLYDLKDDPQELQNIAQAKPDIIEHLTALLKEYYFPGGTNTP